MKRPLLIGWRTRSRLVTLEGLSKDEAHQRLAVAYQNVFGRDGEDVEMVLADLADHCGFYKVEAGGVDAADLNHAAGRRTVFARIWSFLTLSDSQLAMLENAARNESSFGGDPG